jgi:hypothetical protein
MDSFAIAELEEVVLATSAQAKKATIDDLGSAAFMVDLASMAHETQYTRQISRTSLPSSVPSANSFYRPTIFSPCCSSSPDRK